MKRIGFVTPWFGENIPGGAEMELRSIATHLQKSGLDVEILTTCVKEFASNWNTNFYAEGIYKECGMTVRRFQVRKRDTQLFDSVNAKLINGQKISDEEEQIFSDHMINSPGLYSYMDENKQDYSLFVFIPYMFGTTINGCTICPEKSVIIPCLHDESYAYLKIFKKHFSSVAGMIFNALPEAELAQNLYDLSKVQTAVLGIGLNTDIIFEKNRFIEKYNMNEPYILYAGRKDSGKNVDTLLKYFSEFKKRNVCNLKLVLLGGGKIDIPHSVENDVYDLGFIPVQDKYDAYAGATALCQPSHFESFSLVIMESWLCERPVLVNGGCNVTKHFAISSNAGLYFNNYFEFEGCINYFLQNETAALEMGQNGRKFVLDNFTWDVIVEKYNDFFNKISKD